MSNVEWPIESSDPAGVPGFTDFTVGGACDLGWRAFKANYGMLLAIVTLSLVLGAVLWGVQYVLQIIPLFGVLVGLALNVLVGIPLAAGAAYVGVKACRREPVLVADLFFGFSRYGEIVVIGLLNGLIVIACILPLYCLAGAAVFAMISSAASKSTGLGITAVVLTVVGMLAGGLLVIVISTRFSLAKMVCLDPVWDRPGPVQSMKISWRLTGAPWIGLIVLAIVNVLIAMGSFVLLGVGLLLLGWPLILAVNGAAYCLIVSPYFGDRCGQCGYDLSGVQGGVCPECGAAAPAERGMAWRRVRGV